MILSSFVRQGKNASPGKNFIAAIASPRKTQMLSPLKKNISINNIEHIDMSKSKELITYNDRNINKSCCNDSMDSPFFDKSKKYHSEQMEKQCNIEHVLSIESQTIGTQTDLTDTDILYHEASEDPVDLSPLVPYPENMIECTCNESSPSNVSSLSSTISEHTDETRSVICLKRSDPVCPSALATSSSSIGLGLICPEYIGFPRHTMSSLPYESQQAQTILHEPILQRHVSDSNVIIDRKPNDSSRSRFILPFKLPFPFCRKGTAAIAPEIELTHNNGYRSNPLLQRRKQSI
jgi:hypothetical protein